MKILHRARQMPTQDGDGVQISRIMGGQHNMAIDPLLMIDEIKTENPEDVGGSFPAHPHAGLDTFSYMKQGGFAHKDSRGHEASIGPTHTQYMSTGTGVLHSEMAIGHENGMHGFQIWVNMPDKNLEPVYLDSNDQGNEIVTQENGNSLRALAGDWTFNNQKVKAAVPKISAGTRIADITIAKGEAISLGEFDESFVGIFIYEGKLADGVSNGSEILVIDPEDELILKADSSNEVNALVFVGEPVRKPVFQYGPFVGENEQDIRRYMTDYQSGKFGYMS